MVYSIGGAGIAKIIRAGDGRCDTLIMNALYYVPAQLLAPPGLRIATIRIVVVDLAVPAYTDSVILSSLEKNVVQIARGVPTYGTCRDMYHFLFEEDVVRTVLIVVRLEDVEIHICSHHRL